MTVLVIDPLMENIKVKEISDDEKKRLADLQFLVGGNIERACDLESGDEVLVNEEGLFIYDKFVEINGKPFAGPGVVVRADSKGDYISAEITKEELEPSIKFLTRQELVADRTRKFIESTKH